MAKGFNKDVSASRRGFFRQLMISGLDVVQQAGQAMADRAGIDTRPAYQSPNSTAKPAWPAYDPYGSTYGSTYGPPWPPRFGPPTPPALRAKLRDIGRTTHPASVSQLDSGD